MARAAEVVVAGADGTLGSFLTRRLGATGVTLRCPPGAEEAPAGPEVAAARAVVNAAGPRVRPGLTWADYHREHVGTAARLARGMTPGAHLVHLSSTSVYGARGARLGVASPEAPLRFPNPAYACAKLAAEGIVRRICGERGVRLSILRLSTVYGPELDSVLGTLVGLARRGAPLQLRPATLPQHWLHAELLAAALGRAVEGVEAPLAIAADPFVLTNADLNRAIARVAGRRPALPVPIGLVARAMARWPRQHEPPGPLAAFAVLGLANEFETRPLFDALGLDPAAFSKAATFDRLVEEG